MHAEEPQLLRNTLGMSRKATPPYSDTMTRCAFGYYKCTACPQMQNTLDSGCGV